MFAGRVSEFGSGGGRGKEQFAAVRCGAMRAGVVVRSSGGECGRRRADVPVSCGVLKGRTRRTRRESETRIAAARDDE